MVLSRYCVGSQQMLVCGNEGKGSVLRMRDVWYCIAVRGRGILHLAEAQGTLLPWTDHVSVLKHKASGVLSNVCNPKVVSIIMNVSALNFITQDLALNKPASLTSRSVIEHTIRSRNSRSKGPRWWYNSRTLHSSHHHDHTHTRGQNYSNS